MLFLAVFDGPAPKQKAAVKEAREKKERTSRKSPVDV